MQDRKGSARRSVCDATNIGADYTPEEKEFLKIMDAWCTKHRRRPTDTEVLRIAKAAGYKRVTQ
jgi:hypothetical protein